MKLTESQKQERVKALRFYKVPPSKAKIIAGWNGKRFMFSLAQLELERRKKK